MTGERTYLLAYDLVMRFPLLVFPSWHSSSVNVLIESGPMRENHLLTFIVVLIVPLNAAPSAIALEGGPHTTL